MRTMRHEFSQHGQIPRPAAVLSRGDTGEPGGLRSGSHQLLSHAGEAHGGEQVPMRQVYEVVRRAEDHHDPPGTRAPDSNAETLPLRFRHSIKDETSAQGSVQRHHTAAGVGDTAHRGRDVPLVRRCRAFRIQYGLRALLHVRLRLQAELVQI